MDFVDFMALLMGILMFHQWTRTIYLIVILLEGDATMESWVFYPGRRTVLRWKIMFNLSWLCLLVIQLFT